MAISDWLATGTANAWVGVRFTPVSVGNLIARQSVSITITRDVPASHSTTTLAAQTVRLDILSSAREEVAFNEVATFNEQGFILLGYKNHPTVADTNIQVEDTFVYDGRLWTVRKVEAGLTDRVLALVTDTGYGGGG